MNITPRQHCSAIRLFVGWFALLLYVGAASPLGMGLAALVGALDPDHHALVQTEIGSTRLVLHHEQKCAGHHHGLAARALTLFAQPPSGGEPDHVLQFRTANTIAQRTLLSTPSPAQFDQPALAVSAPPAGSARDGLLASLASLPPSGGSGQLFCLRSTVLLI